MCAELGQYTERTHAYKPTDNTLTLGSMGARVIHPTLVRAMELAASVGLLLPLAREWVGRTTD